MNDKPNTDCLVGLVKHAYALMQCCIMMNYYKLSGFILWYFV